jgi:lipid-binding SYLF domain-containing protein
MRKAAVTSLLVFGFTVARGALADVAGDRDEVLERLAEAAKALNEVLDAPDRGIPQDLLDRSSCVAVIPNMFKAGLVFGGRYGRGAVACRSEGGEGPWSAPAMIRLGGGSFGLQIGASSVDVVMLIMNPDGIELLLKDKFTLGGDASVAAGPVGRAGTAETDVLMTAKILTYSRSKGLFAGLEVKGAVVAQDRDANRALYGQPVEARRVLVDGEMAVPPGAQVFVGALARHSPEKSKKSL